MDKITLSHIEKSYTTQSADLVIGNEKRKSRTRKVLSDLSVSFPAGQISVILGRSGCGKSTLLRMLYGEEKPDAGEISLPAGFRSTILTPSPYLISWTNVLQNVAMAAGVGHNPEERLELSKEFVRIVGLSDVSDMTPPELSTGMRQRLGLARVLASQAQILLMDEPFAALDFITREEMQHELLRIQSKMPRTIILVTHQLAEALLLAQRIYVMHPDCTMTEFDLSQYDYPRDLSQPVFQALEKEITAQCRR